MPQATSSPEPGPERITGPQASSARRALFLRLSTQLSLKDPDDSRCLQAHRQSPSPCLLQKHTRSQGPSLHRHYPASTVILPCPTPADAAARSDVEAATLAPHGCRQRRAWSNRCGLCPRSTFSLSIAQRQKPPAAAPPPVAGHSALPLQEDEGFNEKKRRR
jgi:hypothetical protein